MAEWIVVAVCSLATLANFIILLEIRLECQRLRTWAIQEDERSRHILRQVMQEEFARVNERIDRLEDEKGR